MTTRMLPFATLIATGWVLAAGGCYESREGVPRLDRDGGSTQLPGDAAADGEATVPTDGATIDAARVDAGTAACGDVVALYEGTGCSDATRACLAACPAEDAACPDECIASDEECNVCVNQTLVRCANETGCQDAWDTFACCAREEPACDAFVGLELLACAAACDGELIEYDACFQSIGGSACILETISRCGLEP